MDANQWIAHLQLQPHPEGGFYKETYRAEGFMQVGTEAVAIRNYSTAIYFLLQDDNFSAFHRIASDEVWHYYGGGILELFEVDGYGILRRTLIGNQINEGAVPQHVVPAGHWFASRVLGAQGYVLTGCTVSPGFDFQDFEMAGRQALTLQFPQHKEIITALTRIG